MYTFEYDTDYDPAMPNVDITIVKPGTYEERTVVAVIDSGADATFIPERLLKQLKISQTGWVSVRGVAGFSYRVPTYIALLKIQELPIGFVRVGGDQHSNHVILGRDVLNQFIVTLNGLANVVTLSD